MESQMKGKVESLRDNGVTTISFFHPQSNSLPGKLLSDIAGAITDAGNDDACRVIILRSEGEKAFCAGASFDELVAVQDMEQGRKFFSGFAGVINAIRKCPKFVIGRVHGKAVGGGVGVASAVDHCFALRSASVKLSELAVGIGPFVVGPAVERKVGASAFSAMAIDATAWWTAEWAHQKGLYSNLFDTAEEMDLAIEALATKLASSNPEAMKQLKSVFWEGTEHWDELLAKRAQISGELVLSDFTREAITRFKAGAR